MTDTSVLRPSLAENQAYIRLQLGNSTDVKFRSFLIGETEAVLIYTDGLTDQTAVHKGIIEPIMHINEEVSLKQLKQQFVTTLQVDEFVLLVDILQAIVSGRSVLLMDHESTCFGFGTAKSEERSVEEPTNETVIRGPREGFVENIRVNTALVRRRVKSPQLWIEKRTIGTVSQTELNTMYVDGLVNQKIVDELTERLNRIDVDSVLDSGMIEELIQDQTFTPFPTIIATERPDVVAAAVLEGRVALFLDGSPNVLLLPSTFVQFFQSAEDYTIRSDISSLIRMLRYVALFVTLLAPSVYVAVTTFHQEMVPSALLISLAAQREGVPFPAIFEALMMELIFEVLREAGVRMPRIIGQAVSIVGALVLGTAAVEAGIVSAAMVIVVSITAITSFTIPNYMIATAIRLVRFPFMLLASTFGLLGIAIGLLLLVMHLCNLRSFGVPYMEPLAPFIASEQEDAILRFPKWGLRKRPKLLAPQNRTRSRTPEPKPRGES